MVIDNTNNTFTSTVDGKISRTLALAEGTYTRDELASQIEAVVNSDEELLGRSVSVSVSVYRARPPGSGDRW